MKELSIFVDESGDFGKYASHSPYYIVSMVFHNQDIDISSQIKILDFEMERLGYRNHAIHTEPLIRREECYRFLEPNERRTLFSKLFYFVCKSDIRYKSFTFFKRKYSNELEIEKKMIQEISFFIRENLVYFYEFDKVILYYDNGQHELNKILKTVLETELTNCEIRKVLPKDYKLFQAADMVCTLELLKNKIEMSQLSRSEELIFYSKRELKKDFLKPIKKKEFKA